MNRSPIESTCRAVVIVALVAFAVVGAADAPDLPTAASASPPTATASTLRSNDAAGAFAVGVGREVLECIRPVPSDVADPSGLVVGWPTRVLDVALAVDAEFEGRYPNGAWRSVAEGWLSEASAVFERDVDVEFRVVDAHAHLPGMLAATHSADLLDELRAHYLADHADLARDDVHLFTGKELSNAIGQANCIGGAGDPNVAFTVSMGAHLDPTVFRGFSLDNNEYVKVAAHEIAHIMSAHHHYGNCAEAVREYSVREPVEACTLMFPFVEFQELRLSTVNRLVTRGWVDAHGL